MGNRKVALTCIFILSLITGLILAPLSRSGSYLFAAGPAGKSPAPQTFAYQVFLPHAGRTIGALNPYGIVMYGAIDAANGTQKMQAAGATWVTALLDWGTIEPSEGVYDWSSFDTNVANAKAAGLQVRVLFTGDPSWAWLPDHSATVPQKRLDFVQQMAERYNCNGVNDAPGQLCVHDWSFYPEPDAYYSWMANVPGSKGYWGHRPGDYATMIAGVADTIHAVDPSAHVMIGGLAYDSFEDQGGRFVRTFLNDVLYTLNTQYGGATKYLDTIAFHYYPLSFASLKDKIQTIRAIMTTYGVDQLPLVIPEAGYWSSTEAGSSETQQAQRLVQMYVQGLAYGVQELSWYAVFDEAPGSEEHGLFWGTDLSKPKMAYSAYSTLTKELAGPIYLSTLNQAGVEGYVFLTTLHQQVTVFWATGTPQQVTFPNQCLRVVDIIGNATTVQDGGAGDQDHATNNSIALAAATDNPVYVSACR